MKYNAQLLCSLFVTSSLLVACGGSSDNSDSGDSSSTTSSTTTTDSSTTTTSSLVINEIVASAADGGNDWNELYATADSINLADYTLVDDSADREPQALPDITLSTGEFIVIQAIDEEDTPPTEGYYVTFKLGSDDAVTLYQDGEQVDQLAWDSGDAPEGSSYGLYTDGSSNATTLTPTPAAANQAASTSVTVTLDTLINEDAPIRINEVVAKDADSGYDWIEFYVTGTDAINLADYRLSDSNNETVSLPEVTLAPGALYRVYATTDEVAELSTVAFKLGAEDQVNLYQDDDLVDQLSWNKGQALIGYSYGRFPDGSDATQVLTPSPLATNSTASHGPLVINEVVADDINAGDDWFELYNNGSENISLADYSVIDESDDIEPVSLPDITLAPGEYVVIFATEDDISDYAVPFKLGKNDELTLLLNDETVDYIDWDSSDVVAGFSYGLSAASSSNISYQRRWHKDFLTPSQGTENIVATAFNPTEVHNLSIDISSDDWQDMLNNPLEEEYHSASITFNGITLDSVAIRTKGGSSLRSVAQSSSDRYSFKVDINEYVDGQKFFGLKKFTLQNSFNDPSYMREVIAYELLTEMGVAAPEHAYVNVYINDELFGFYLMVEVIDGEFIENHFDNANGDLYKPDGTGSDLVWINDQVSSYSDINLQNNEESTDNGAFINFVEQLDNGSTEVIDVDSLLRYMSVSVALSNLDSYHGVLAHNYYIYEQDGTFGLLPWDFNESFGSFNMGCRLDIRGLYIDEPVSVDLADRPMVANVFADQANLTTYHQYLSQLINGSLADDAFEARVNSIANLISEHVANDPSSFYSHSQFLQNLTSSVDNYYGLTEFMSYRVDNITKQLQGDLASAGNGSGYCD